MSDQPGSKNIAAGAAENAAAGAAEHAAANAAANAAAPSSGPRRSRYLVAALVTAGLCALPIAWFQLIDTADVGKTRVATQIVVLLGLFGYFIWLAVATRLPRALRFAPLVLLVTGLAAAGGLHAAGIMRMDFTGGMRIRLELVRDRQLADQAESPAGEAAAAAPPDAIDFPQFLGPNRDGMVNDVRLDADWTARPPEELWRRQVGEGWSGFAVVGRSAVTQEQRGENEAVVCYDLVTGRLRWIHQYPARFDELMGGLGPRATPTIDDGRVYALGATGILSCLELQTGKPLWSRDILAENHAPNVKWGKSGSPLVAHGKVIVSAGGPGGNSLVAYDAKNGGRLWSAGDRLSAYASPVLAELCGVRQVLVVNQDWLTAHELETGRVLWEYPWPGSSGANASCSQPVPLPGDRVFVSKAYSHGAALVAVSRDADAWNVEEVWANPRVMKTKLNNVVIRDGYVYGLDENILQCAELETGRMVWKERAGQYGHGQLLLVGDLILVMTEDEGDVVLVEATPAGLREVARHPVLDGKTWNNPALAGAYLLVRNAQWAACYRLPLRP